MKKTIVIVWGSYPPTIGGGSARMYRVANYLSNFLNIILFTEKIKGTRIVDNNDSLAAIRLPPSNPKRNKSKHFVYYIQIAIYFLVMTIRIILLYPLLSFICIKTRPICIIKEATRWDFGIIEEIIKPNIIFMLFRPWVFASKIFKIPLYVYFTDLTAHKKHTQYLAAKLKHANFIIVVDLWMKEFFESEFDIKKPIYYVPVSVNLNDFENNNLKSPNENKILFVGRLAEDRGCDVLIKAIPKIIITVPNIKVDIIGDGYQKSRLIQMAKELGVANYVSFRGAINPQEISKVYDGAKLFINPLRDVGIGNVTIEAMASGVPVIKSKIGINNDPIIEGMNGHSFIVNDHEDLAIKIVHVLMKNNDEWEKMSLSARLTAEKYSIKHTSDQLLQILNIS